MLTEEEFEGRFDLFEGFIEELEDEVIDSEEGDFYPEDSNQEMAYKSLFVNELSYNSTYEIFGRQDKDIFVIIYKYNFINTLEDVVQSDEAKEIFSLDEFTLEDPRDAVIEVLNRVNDDDINRLSYNLHDKISNAETLSRVERSENGNIEGFTVVQHTFPSIENYNIRDFYNTVTAVISTGEIGKRYLENSFAIEIPEEVDEDSEFGLIY